MLLALVLTAPLPGCAGQRIETNSDWWYPYPFVYGSCRMSFKVPSGGAIVNRPPAVVSAPKNGVGEVVGTFFYDDENFLINVGVQSIVPSLRRHSR